MDRGVQPRAAFLPVETGKAVEPEQVVVAEFEVEAVLVRYTEELAVAGPRGEDQLHHRFDHLRTPTAGVACEGPPHVDADLGQAACRIDPGRLSEIRLVVDLRRVVCGEVAMQSERPSVAERAGHRPFPVRGQGGAAGVGAIAACYIQCTHVDRRPATQPIRLPEETVLIPRRDQRQAAVGDGGR